MKVVPKPETVQTGAADVAPIAKGVGDGLADRYRLTLKAHAYHWNVEGPLFFSVHQLTEKQHEDMCKAADVIAERIRAFGLLAPMKMAEVLEASVVSDLDQLPSAVEMVKDLADDHERIARRMRVLVEVAEESSDPVTADLVSERSAFHEKSAWMLRATAK